MSVLIFLALLVIAAHVVARWAGLGMCFVCGRPCPLWTNRCGRHTDQGLR